MAVAESELAIAPTPAVGRAAAVPARPEGADGAADFDLHGIVGIRVVDGTPADVAAVSRQLGPIRRPLTRAPDIIVRFVESLETDQRLHFLGVGDAAFTRDEFFILRGKHKSLVRARIPFAEIGGRCEIVCERGAPAVPLLIAIVNFTALSRGFVPLHASAFIYRGRGIVTTGWSKGGKTEALLAFMARGATYVGDEWIYLSPDGRRVFGIPEPITVWDWHLQQMPEVREQIRWRDGARLAAAGALVKLLQGVRSSRFIRWCPFLGGKGAARFIDGAMPLLKRQLSVNIDPGRAFGKQGEPRSAPFDALFLVGNHESPETSVEAASSREIAERMVHSLHAERSVFLEYYAKYLFAFPGRENRFIERAGECERAALLRIFQSKPAFAAFHPYPVRIAGLFDSMAPFVTEAHHEGSDYAAD